MKYVAGGGVEAFAQAWTYSAYIDGPWIIFDEMGQKILLHVSLSQLWFFYNFISILKTDSLLRDLWTLRKKTYTSIKIYRWTWLAKGWVNLRVDLGVKVPHGKLTNVVNECLIHIFKKLDYTCIYIQINIEIKSVTNQYRNNRFVC